MWPLGELKSSLSSLYPLGKMRMDEEQGHYWTKCRQVAFDCAWPGLEGALDVHNEGLLTLPWDASLFRILHGAWCHKGGPFHPQGTMTGNRWGRGKDDAWTCVHLGLYNYDLP